MNRNLYQTFKEIKEFKPSPRLEGLVLSKIKSLKEKQSKRKLALSYFSLTGSFGAFALAVFKCGNAFLQSDFWILLKLLSTDASLVLGNWSDFLFSLLETFPIVSATIILIPVFALLLSFSAYFKSIRKNHYNCIFDQSNSLISNL